MALRRKTSVWLAALVMLFVVIPFTGIYFAQGALTQSRRGGCAATPGVVANSPLKKTPRVGRCL